MRASGLLAYFSSIQDVCLRLQNTGVCNKCGKLQFTQINLESMQPVVPPIYVCDLQGDLNSLPLACLCLPSVTLQLIFANHLHIQLIFADISIFS